MKLLIATSNQGKLKEYQALLKTLSINLTYLQHFNYLNNLKISETGKTFQQNALIKAQNYGQKARILTLADDTGLCIDYLNGFPGIYSARFAKGDFKKANQKIINQLKHLPRSQRTAQFKCSLALFNPQTEKTHTFFGSVSGYIVLKPSGTQGFGYDSIFFCPQINQTFGQNQKLKYQVSHRTKAVKKLIAYFKKTKLA